MHSARIKCKVYLSAVLTFFRQLFLDIGIYCNLNLFSRYSVLFNVRMFTTIFVKNVEYKRTTVIS